MTVTIDSRNPRSVAALGLVVRAGQWPRCRLKDGQKYYAVPSRSRPGLYHLADTQTCTCEDHKNRGADCAHILAVRLHVAQVRAKASLRARRPRHSPAELAAAGAKYERIMGDHFGEEG
jgi:hypothetical protein